MTIERRDSTKSKKPRDFLNMEILRFFNCIYDKKIVELIKGY